MVVPLTDKSAEQSLNTACMMCPRCGPSGKVECRVRRRNDEVGVDAQAQHATAVRGRCWCGGVLSF